MPAVWRDSDPQFSVPGFLAVKVDSDGFAAFENAAVVAIGVAPQGLQFARGLAGTPVFRVAAADILKLFGDVDDGHDPLRSLFASLTAASDDLVNARSSSPNWSVTPSIAASRS